jgi:hypothetical protein
MISATMVIARELATSGVQDFPLLEGHQVAPVILQIHVTAQEKQTEHTVNRSPPSAHRRASAALED